MHICLYIKSDGCIDLCYDPTKSNIWEATILQQETALGQSKVMKTMYPDARDLKSGNYPRFLGRSMQLYTFVGVPLDSPCDVFCNNQAVTTSTMHAKSTLKKD